MTVAQLNHARAIRDAPRYVMEVNFSQNLWFPTATPFTNPDNGGQQIADSPTDSIFQDPAGAAGVWNGRRGYIHSVIASDAAGTASTAIFCIEPFWGGPNTTSPITGGDGSYIPICITISRGNEIRCGFFMDQGFRINCAPTYLTANLGLPDINTKAQIVYSVEGGGGF